MTKPIELGPTGISASYKDRKPTLVRFGVPNDAAWQQVMRLLGEAGVDVSNELVPTRWMHETAPDGREYIRFDFLANTTPVIMRVNLTTMTIPDARWITDLATEGVPVKVYAAYDIALYKRVASEGPSAVPRERLNLEIEDRAAIANLRTT